MWISIKQLLINNRPLHKLKKFSALTLWLHQIPAYILSHTASLLIGLISVSILPRVLGLEQYGTYTLIIVTSNVVISLFGEWLVPSGIRFSSEDNLIWSILGWLAAFSSFLGVIVVGILLYNQHLFQYAYFGASLFTASMILSKPLTAYVRASLQQKLIIGYSFIGGLVPLLFGLSLFFVSRKLTWLIIGLSILPCVLFFIYSFKFRWFLLRPEINLLQHVLRFGFPIVITSIGSQILQFADRYMLALFKTHIDVGIYNVTYNLSDKVLGLGYSILFSSMYPIGSRFWAQGEEAEARNLLVNLFKFSGIFAGSFICFQAVSGVSLVKLLAGEAFCPPSLIPFIIAFSSWLWFIGILQHQPFEWSKRTLWITLMTFLSAILNLLLNLLLIPTWGMIGAAAATLFSYAAYLIICTFTSKTYGYYGLVWQPWIVLGTGLAAFLLWYSFKGSASLWKGILISLFYITLSLWSLFLNKGRVK